MAITNKMHSENKTVVFKHNSRTLYTTLLIPLITLENDEEIVRNHSSNRPNDG